LVDVRYVSVYGSIYAIADISYSVAYAIGPIIAGGVVEAIGFTALNVGIAFSNLLYAPVLMYLRHIYDFKPLENEANILMSDPPDKEYQTYTMQDQKPVIGDLKNHLEYSRFADENTSMSNAYYPDGQITQMQETNVDKHMAEGPNGYPTGGSNYYTGQQFRQDPISQQQQQQHAQQGYQPHSQQQGYQPQQQRQQPSYSNVNAQRSESSRGDMNPFRAQGAGGEMEAGDKNPFRQGLGY
jgi:DHA1 family vesicular acetylcholine transporter-like MFS transporter 3